MSTIDERIQPWIQHFRDLGADIQDIKLTYMGWKWAIEIWEAEPYHKIAQAMQIKELKINFDDELFFRTERVPKDIPKCEWSIRLSKYQVPIFREKYGQHYRITSL